MVELVVPIVHLNGTGKESLLEARERCYEQLRLAAVALADMGPNGRDYYPEPGRMERAIDQHNRRMGWLRQIMTEIEVECEMINEGRI